MWTRVAEIPWTVTAAWVVSAAVVAAGCGPGDSATNDSGGGDPAVAACAELGGTVFGSEPMCGLPDGSSVNAQELLASNGPADFAIAAPDDEEPTTTPASATTTTVAPTTTAAPTTTTTTTTTVPERLAFNGEPFRYSYPTVEELPDFPIDIDGYIPIEGVERTTARVFDDGEVAVAYDFPWVGNRCEYWFWVARWTTTSPEWAMYATNEIYANEPANYVFEDWMLPPPAQAGLLGGFGCSTPGFIWAGPSEPGATLLSDVFIEYQAYELDVFAAGSTSNEAAEPAPQTCSGYTYDDQLPISVCSEGFSVRLFQEALGLPADGYFGPGTQDAVIAYQTSNGLPVTGEIDATTWDALGVTVNAPFPDLNGDGVVDGSELPGT